MYQENLSEYQSTACPAESCDYEGDSERSVSTHWAHKHEGPCPLTNTLKECVGCGTSFWASDAMQRHRAMEYCGRECYESSARADLTTTCEQCGSEFTAEDGHDLESRKYCSQECTHRAYRGGKDCQRKKCPECGTGFETVPSQDHTFCSPRCANNHRDAGRTTLNQKYRDAERARGWRETVFERDEYTCQLCSERGGDLHAHHKTPVATILVEAESLEEAKNHRLFADSANGVTVCESCHRNRCHNNDRQRDMREEKP